MLNFTVDDSLPAMERIFVFKYLGVCLDSNLNFRDHKQEVFSRISSGIGALLSIRRVLDDHTFILLFKCDVLSIIDYSLTNGYWCFSLVHVFYPKNA